MKDLNKLKIHELRDVAKEYAIVGRWHMNKKKLKDSIKEAMKKKEEGIHPCHKSLKDLLKEAKKLKIVGIGMLNKNGLREVIRNKKEERQTINEVVTCIHEDDFFSCLICKEKRFCIHGMKKYFCRDCGGTQICKHDKKLFNCFPCAEERRRENKDKLMKVACGVLRIKKTGGESESESEGESEDKSDSNKKRRVVPDWITDGEEEDEEDEVEAVPVERRFEGERRMRGGCLIEEYDNIYDLVADLNAKDD